jgi:hypothetical protein
LETSVGQRPKKGGDGRVFGFDVLAVAAIKAVKKSVRFRLFYDKKS